MQRGREKIVLALIKKVLRWLKKKPKVKIYNYYYLQI